MLKKFLSRKLGAFIVSAVLIPFLSSHGFPPEIIAWVSKIALVYIGAQGAVDTLAGSKVPKE